MIWRFVILLLVCVLCRCTKDEEGIDKNLVGSWAISSNAINPVEFLTFDTKGNYEIIDSGYFASFRVGDKTFSKMEKARLSGRFTMTKKEINFRSATIDFYPDAIVDHDLLSSPGSVIGSFYGFDLVGVSSDSNFVVKDILRRSEYVPVKWQIIYLTRDSMKVSKDSYYYEFKHLQSPIR